MLIHLDTSLLVDAFTGPHRMLPSLVAATRAGHVIECCALVEYEWLRGPRVPSEVDAVTRFLGPDGVVAFGRIEAATAARLFRQARRARQRQADLVVAACAIERGARLWTLNPSDFEDLPGLMLFSA